MTMDALFDGSDAHLLDIRIAGLAALAADLRAVASTMRVLAERMEDFACVDEEFAKHSGEMRGAARVVDAWADATVTALRICPWYPPSIERMAE